MWWSSKLSLAKIAILCLSRIFPSGCLGIPTREAADDFERGMIGKVAMNGLQQF